CRTVPVKKPSILAQSPQRSAAHPWQYAALAAMSLFAVAAFGTAPDTVLETVPTRLVERVLPLPAIKDDDAGTPYWREERVQRGDTLGSLLARAGVNDAEAMQYLRTDPAARPLYQLKPGRPVQVAVDEDGDLVALRLLTNTGERLVIERDDNGFRSARSVPS